MAVYKGFLLAVLLVATCDAAWKRKRSPDDASKKPDWKPVDTPQEFSVMVDDNINKADQFRHETWKPGGVIEGEYAAPTRDGKWLKVHYVADDKGFRVLDQKVVTEEELNHPSKGAASANKANVETLRNGKKLEYTVDEKDAKKAKPQTNQEHSGL